MHPPPLEIKTVGAGSDGLNSVIKYSIFSEFCFVVSACPWSGKTKNIKI
jgi:hypothetical protein